VEQKPEEIYSSVLTAVKECLSRLRHRDSKAAIAACGIANQRETFCLWDSEGRPLHNAVSWQCKRSIDLCREIKKEEKQIRERTGLLADPYFSASKVSWLARHSETVHGVLRSGGLRFGTVDTWLLYRLSGGCAYHTDYTNASRTLLFNIKSLDWDNELLDLFSLRDLLLPEPSSSSSAFGWSNFEGLLDSPVPITALIGDSHSAAYGECCFSAGEGKVTIGTGSSVLMNIGTRPLPPAPGLVSTICFSDPESLDYGQEGIIVSSGATLKWLKDSLGLFTDFSECEQSADSVDSNAGVYLVPAFAGLGAPYWYMDARACICGLSFESDKRHLLRAGLESIAYQIADTVFPMASGGEQKLLRLSVDGGGSTNRFLMQFLADLLGVPVDRIGFPDVTALGAAYLAGRHIDYYGSRKDLEKLRVPGSRYTPSKRHATVMKYYKGWKAAVRTVTAGAEE
jgi:glycerol kinase